MSDFRLVGDFIRRLVLISETLPLPLLAN